MANAATKATTKAKEPTCPQCRRKGRKVPGGLWQCPVGHGFFDDDPDEGGPQFSDPHKSAESKESYLARQRQRRR